MYHKVGDIMKKNIMIFGGSLFINEAFNQMKYKVLNNKLIIKLKGKFEIDNFSSIKLTTSKSIKFMKEFIKVRQYSDCVIALGEADIELNNKDEFKSNLITMVNILKEHNINPLMVSLPKNYRNDIIAMEYQEIIDSVVNSENLQYVYYGDTDLDVSYKVTTKSQMKRAIIDFCK